jgi:hypothetical protein
VSVRDPGSNARSDHRVRCRCLITNLKTASAKWCSKSVNVDMAVQMRYDGTGSCSSMTLTRMQGKTLTRSQKVPATSVPSAPARSAHSVLQSISVLRRSQQKRRHGKHHRVGAKELAAATLRQARRPRGTFQPAAHRRICTNVCSRRRRTLSCGRAASQILQARHKARRTATPVQHPQQQSRRHVSVCAVAHSDEVRAPAQRCSWCARVVGVMQWLICRPLALAAGLAPIPGQAQVVRGQVLCG